VSAPRNFDPKLRATGRRLHGRFTLYGEYLMHTSAWGYVAPVPMSLITGTPGQTGYCPSKDGTANLLRQMGFNVVSSISGDLPFGQGFASSTVLAMLHLGNRLNERDQRQIIRVVDWIQHGFEPSGVDYYAIRAQAPGFFARGKWRPAPAFPLSCVFCAIKPGPERQPGNTRAIISGLLPTLSPIAENMTRQLASSGRISTDDLFSYSRQLYDADVYSLDQRDLIARALALGMPAKGIGGLYNKAVMLIGDIKTCIQLASTVPGVSVLGTVEGNVVY
jgi:hypothetical protein